MQQLNRRNFLKTTAVISAGAALSARSWAQVAGANSVVRMGVIGFHSRGAEHIKEWTTLPGVRLTALCDVDAKVLEGYMKRRGKEVEAEAAITSTGKKGGKVKSMIPADVEGYTDLRKLLENKNVDAVSIATPNHWHTLAAIWAMQAGKDVYVEKPVSHNVWEGRQLTNLTAKSKQIVAAGTQCRSSLVGIGEAVKYVQAGNLGKINIARGLCYKPRNSIGKTTGPQPVPSEIEYDLWCGPAPLEQPRRNGSRGSVHYDWHWFWAYGNGDLGNQGIHQMDIARWFLGEEALAPFVMSVGGRLGYIDDGETPNTQIVYQGYEKAPLIFEVRGLPKEKGAEGGKKDVMDNYKGASVGVVIECEKGYVVVPNYTESTAYDNNGKEIKKWKGSVNHFENFLNAVRSRKASDLNGPVSGGHISSGLCHTGNISYRLGAKKSPSEIKEAIKSYKGLSETFERMSAHLKANGVNIDSDQVTLGVPLKFDPKSEQFAGNEAANKLLTRDYRKPYVVPAA